MRGGGGGHGYGGSGGASGRPQTRFCLSVTMEMKKSIMGYSPGGLKPFLRISLATPNLVAPARGIMESGLSLGGGDGGGGATGSRAFLTYESNVLYTLRFMVDKGVVGGCWVTLPRGRYCLGPAGRVGAGAVDASSPTSPASHSTATHCQIEAHIHARDLVAHAPEGEWARLAPLRVLSFDIECAGRKVWTFPPFFPTFLRQKKRDRNGQKRSSLFVLSLPAFPTMRPPKQNTGALPGAFAGPSHSDRVDGDGEKIFLTFFFRRASESERGEKKKDKKETKNSPLLLRSSEMSLLYRSKASPPRRSRTSLRSTRAPRSPERK
jgi:hypothetical protein